jgi:uncharacterized protein (DUF433 family)
MFYPPLDGHPQITIDPDIMVGKPCIKGTRIPVDLVLSLLGAGDTVENIIEDYPFLGVDDIRAALTYAASAMHPPRLQAAE